MKEKFPKVSGLSLFVLPEVFAICRLEAAAELPDWAVRGGFVSITRTADELSIVCPVAAVPPNITAETGWQGLKVDGPLDFKLTGILASLAEPLAAAKISVFALSTYDTDYLFVRAADLERACDTLIKSGHDIAR